MARIRTISMTEEDEKYIKERGLNFSGMMRLGVKAQRENWQEKAEKIPKLTQELERISQEMYHYQALYNEVRQTLSQIKAVSGGTK